MPFTRLMSMLYEASPRLRILKSITRSIALTAARKTIVDLTTSGPGSSPRVHAPPGFLHPYKHYNSFGTLFLRADILQCVRRG